MTEENNNKVQDKLSRLADCDQVRGETPDDIQVRASQICADYLDSEWKNVKENEIIVTRIKGGLSNQAYKCSLPDNVLSNGQPKHVMLRLYGSKHLLNFDEYFRTKHERLSDAVVGILVAENNIGPKLYGLFPEGELQEFVDGREITAEDEADPMFLKVVATKLARFHYMKAPIKKNINVFLTMEKLYQDSQKEDIQVMIKNLNLTNLMKIDFIKEINWLRDVIAKIDPPVVLNHNDYTKRNMLIKKEVVDPLDRVVIFDHEHASYGYRGRDMSRLFDLWNKKRSEQKPFPSDEVIVPFIELYNQECVKLLGEKYSKSDKNSVERILKEIKVSHLCWGLSIGLLVMTSEPLMKEQTKEDMMHWSDRIVMEYLANKERFRKEGVFQ